MYDVFGMRNNEAKKNLDIYNFRNKPINEWTTNLLPQGATNRYTGTWNMLTKKAREKFMAAIAPMRTEKSIKAPHLSI